ncbi:hypothetical protein [Roseateles saccharophilus]|uniref:Uncharacterized protein n=1 Tax=Roseateles saccharophilus TaxID=304 RepID=A0A4V2VQT3_ROSSA|nr:hypothetical protein [Roseateles saccharophilus]MDG0832687.1 hypothetical protein [Roseateles saccharophilus]TCU95379.1 hypothetical protein EV671_101571 [Roseateles saccharophilus]
MTRRPVRRTSGFTLIDAVLAMVVMGFGMLALVGMQQKLSLSSDIAKQRTEATRLAQDKMEALRAYTTLTGTGSSWNGLANGTDTLSSYSVSGATTQTNTTYTRSWTVGGAATDFQRPVTVAVSWFDASSAPQSLTLPSVIAKMDPAIAGYVGFPLPANTNLKNPKNRSLNIPVQSIPLNNGNSAYQLGSYAIVFNNAAGNVVQRCDTNNLTAANYGSSNCYSLPAYIVTGYISGAVSTGTPLLPTGINTSQIAVTGPGGLHAISCTIGQALDQNSSSPIPGYLYYLCVIPMPATVDATTGVTTITGTWSGTIRLGGVPTTGNYIVCRFQYATSSTVNSNLANVQPYSLVDRSLDDQNYYVATSSAGSCPTVTTTTAQGGSVATTRHQDCRSSTSPSTATDGTCPATNFNTPS